MSENSKPSKNIGDVTGLALIPMFVSILARGLYYGMSFLSIIVVIGAIFISLPFFYWLFKRRKYPGVKTKIIWALSLDILGILSYLEVWFGII